MKPIDSYFFSEPWYHPASIFTRISAIGIALIGLYSFYIGYSLKICDFFAGKIPIAFRNLSVGKAKILCPIMLLIGAASLAYIIYSGGGLFAYLLRLNARVFFFKGKGIFYALSYLIPASAILIYASAINSKQSIKKLYLAIFIIISLIGTSMTGSRFNIIWLILGLLIIRHYSYKRIKTGFIIIIASVLLIFLVIGGVLRKAGEIISVKLSTGIEHMIVSENSIVNAFHMVASQFHPHWELMVLIDSMPEKLEFQYGKTYFAPLFYMIPAAIMKDKSKYDIDMGKIYSKTFFPVDWENGVTFSPGVNGEGYMNFYIFGVIMNMFLLGLLYKSLYNFQLKDPKDKGRLLLYAVCAPLVIRILKGGISASMIQFLYLGTFVFLGGYLIKTKGNIEQRIRKREIWAFFLLLRE